MSWQPQNMAAPQTVAVLGQALRPIVVVPTHILEAAVAFLFGVLVAGHAAKLRCRLIRLSWEGVRFLRAY